MTSIKRFGGYIIWFLLLSFTFTNCEQEIVKEEVITGYTSTIFDIDSNGYQTFGIGAQTWMSSNLRTSRLNNGTQINLVTENSQWEKIDKPGYCWYNNDSIINARFGVLYNYSAVETGLLCPIGWHVPTQDDWNYLIKGFGGLYEAGRKMKGNNRAYNSTIPSPWGPNTFSAPPTFLALPGGLRNAYSDRQFMSADTLAYFWISSSKSNTRHSAIILKLLNDTVFSSYLPKRDGLNIRCVKNK